MPQVFLQSFDVLSIFNHGNGVGMPLWHNKYVQFLGASVCPSVAANRCSSMDSIFNSPTTPVDAGGVCNTFATVNRGLKINFQRGKENPRHGSKKPLAGVFSIP